MSHTNLFQSPGTPSSDFLAPLMALLGGVGTFAFGPEIGLPLFGSGIDLFQAGDRNRQTEKTLAAFLSEIEGATQGLLSSVNQPVLTQDQIRQGIGRPGAVSNEIVQQALPGLQEQGQISGPTTDLSAFGRAIGQQVGGAQFQAQNILSPESLRGALEPIRQQREQVLQGGRIDDPLQLGRDIISEIGGFGTPQTQFSIASESAARLARQNVAGLGNLEQTKASRGVAERNARLPIAAQSELSSARARQSEAALLQATGQQGQALNQRLTELEAGGFDTISNAVAAGRLQLPGILANLAQTGSSALLGLGGLSLQKDQLTSLIDNLGFENALKLLGVEAGAASGVEQDKTNLLDTLLGQGNIDAARQDAGFVTQIQTLLNSLGISIGKPDVLVPVGQTFANVGQQFAANEAAADAKKANEQPFDFGGLFSGLGVGALGVDALFSS